MILIHTLLNTAATGRGEAIGTLFFLAVVAFIWGAIGYSQLRRWDDATIKEAILLDKGTGKGYYTLTDEDVQEYRKSMRREANITCIIGAIFTIVGVILIF